MSADAAPEAVAERVAEWRNRRGRARDEQLDDACDLIEALARDRDLAVAHDRQPYPTAEAYELACAARDRWQARAERAEAALAARTAAETTAALAADAHARAVLAADRAAIPPTRRDGRVDLGVGAGVGGADL